MKKLLSIFLAALILTACQKEEPYKNKGEKTHPITISVGQSEPSRVTISEDSNGVWNTEWEDDDCLSGVRSGKSKIEQFTISDIDITGKSAKFTGEASKDSYMRLLYPYKSGTTYSSEDLYPIDFTLQSCDLSAPYASLSKNGLVMASNLFHVESNLIVTNQVTLKHLAVGGELVITPTSAVTGENYIIKKVKIYGENILAKGTIDIGAVDAAISATRDTITVEITSGKVLTAGSKVSIPFAMAPTTLDNKVTIDIIVVGNDGRDKKVTVIKSEPSKAISLKAATHVTLNVLFDQTAIAVSTPWDGLYPNSEVGELQLSDFENLKSGNNIKTIYIDTPADFAKFAEYVQRGANTPNNLNGSVCYGITVKLRNDLDMNNMPFYPISATYSKGNFRASAYFCGIFDGNDHTISNLKIANESHFTGLDKITSYAIFNRANSATFKNVTFDNLNVTTGRYNDKAAGLLSYAQKKVLIQNCTITNSTIYAVGNNNCLVGGFASSVGQGLDIVSCTVSNSKISGGTVGSMLSRGASKGLIIDCTSYNNTIVGSGIAGSIVGELNYNGSIYRNANIPNECYVIACKASGTVAATKAGGLVGTNWGKVIGCYSTVLVSGTYCGTIVGEQSIYNATLTDALTPAVNNLKQTPYTYACYGSTPNNGKYCVAYIDKYDSKSSKTSQSPLVSVNNFDNALWANKELDMLKNKFGKSITKHNSMTENKTYILESSTISESEVEYMNNAIKDITKNYPFFQNFTSSGGDNEAPDNTLRKNCYKFQFVKNSGSDSETFPYTVVYNN